jgi:hypothetical protein
MEPALFQTRWRRERIIIEKKIIDLRAKVNAMDALANYYLSQMNKQTQVYLVCKEQHKQVLQFRLEQCREREKQEAGLDMGQSQKDPPSSRL